MSAKISALTDGATANATDKIPVERSGANRYITPAYIKTYIASYIVARCHTTGFLNLNAGDEGRLDFDGVDEDPGSAITTGGSWHFTAPVAGRYTFEVAECLMNANGADWSAGDMMQLILYKGTSTYVMTMDALPVFETIAHATAYFGKMLLHGVGTVDLTGGQAAYVTFLNSTADNRYVQDLAQLIIRRVS